MKKIKQAWQSNVAIGMIVYGTIVFPANADSNNQQPWVRDELTLDRSAQIYLSTTFSTKKGKFKALPESTLDKKETVEGVFIVATYRYVYKRPIKDASGAKVDELISTELLDCENHFYGTLKQVRKFKNNITSENATPDADVLMMQTSGTNLGSKLCELYAHKRPAPLERKAINNPAYNPRPSAKNMDAIIDKYTSPKTGAGK